MPAGQRRGLAKWLLILAVIACGRFQRQAYIAGTQHPVADVKEVVVFGFCAIVPYSIYLLAIYLLAGRMKLFPLLRGHAFSPSSTGDRVIRHCVNLAHSSREALVMFIEQRPLWPFSPPAVYRCTEAA